MHDPVDDDVPAGFLFELPAELAKAAPATPPTAKVATDADEAEAERDELGERRDHHRR